MGKYTYKDIYTQVVEEIRKQNQFINFDQFNQQLNRAGIAPLAFGGGGGSLPDISAGQIISAVQDLLESTIPATIISGLATTASSPETDWITVTAGSASVGGKLFVLADDTTIRVPFDGTSRVFYINLYLDRLMVETSKDPLKVTVAKIIVPTPGLTNKVFDNQKDAGPGDAYIQSFKEFKLYGINDHLEEDSIQLLRNNIGEILADNLIGNLRLSENLKITNTQGTLELDSQQVLIKDGNDKVLAKFNKNGTFYYDTNGKEVAKFSVDEARVGNIRVTPSTIESANFVSGALGAGFQINDEGDAEFNNIVARGKLAVSVFEKDTISAIGGNLLVMDSDILDADMTALDSSTLTISGDTAFAVNDILRIKDGVDDEWFQVTSVASAPIYTVTRDKAAQYTSNNNPIWKKGTAVVNYGQSGEGGIYLTSSESNAPYISILTHAGSPWSTTCTHARFGNLNGFLGYATDLFGIAIGNSSEYLKYDPSNGLRISGSVTITGGDIPPKTYYQPNEPGSSDGVNEGDYWVDTDDNNKLYIYSGSAGWQQVAISGSGITTFYQSGIPTSLAAGDIWVDSDDYKLYRAASAGATAIVAGQWVLIPTATTDSSGNLISSVKPGSNIGTPAGAGLYLGADYLGYYDGGNWKSYIDNSGNFTFEGDGSNYISWNGSTLEVRGTLNADDITAGTLTGRTIKTSATGARIEMSDTCFSAFDGASALGNEVFKIATSGPDSGSIYLGDINTGSYARWDNTVGSFSILSKSVPASTEAICQVRICDGNVLANSICLQDPLCDCCYSFLSGGGWYFHDTRGDCIPYVKRIDSGTACTGSQVCLIGWVSSPKVMTSIKTLQSFNSSQAAQCQQWNVYSDTPVFYNNGGIDFGYCFGVHAELVLASAVGGECAKAAAFNTCFCTDTGVCSTCVRAQFQLWCNAACANYYYGTICYAVCYRCLGCLVWCATCFSFIQPHTNITVMKTTTDHCNTVTFPCSAQWEIMLAQVTLGWTDSGFSSATVQCCLCTRAMSACTVDKTVTWSQSCIGTCGTWLCCCYNADAITVAGTKPTNTYCTYICYCLSGHVNCLYNCLCHRASSGCGWSCVRTDFYTGSGFSLYSNNSCYLAACSGIDVICGPSNTCWCKVLTCVDMTACTDAAVNSFTICSCFRDCFHQCNIGCMAFGHTLCSQVNLTSGNVFHCHCVLSGAAACCALECTQSLTDTYGAQTILDASGCLNWIAMAYS